MKKLIVFSVIFALLVPAVFAADLGVEVFGGVRLLQGDDGDDITGDGGMTRLRIEGSGENGDGTFGAWYRLDWDNDWGLPEASGLGGWVRAQVQGLAWWKPIDQFKLAIGSNSDGIWGTEGWAGWMFYQMPSETGVVVPDNVWGYGYGPFGGGNYSYRDVFFGGHSGDGLMLEITPVDLIGINVSVPFFHGGTLEDLFGELVAQVNLNLDFGTIAITFDGATKVVATGESEPRIHAALDLSAVDNLGLNFGISYQFGSDENNIKRTNPFGVGFGLKFDVNDDFGLKARAVALLGASTEVGSTTTNDPTIIGADVLPYYGISDNLKAFFGLGLTVQAPDEGDAEINFHLNPYLQVGAEWGPTFYAGFRLWSEGGLDDGIIKWEVPIGLIVSF